MPACRATPRALPPPWLPDGGDEHARKADGAAQGLGGGHAVSLAVNKVGEDNPQKTLGAVQDAAKGTGEQGNSDVVEGILRGGLPQAQCPQRSGRTRPLGMGRGRRSSSQAAQPSTSTAAQHEPHPCKAENGGRVGGVDGEEPVTQLDERESRTPHGVAEDGDA